MYVLIPTTMAWAEECPKRSWREGSTRSGPPRCHQGGPDLARATPDNHTLVGASSARYGRLAGYHSRHHAPRMFTVTEAEAAAIRTAFEQQGELSAAIELRRLFPGVTDNVQARECARVIAGWKPLPPCPPRLRRREALKRSPEVPGGHPKGT
jgi:hypothetical protein